MVRKPRKHPLKLSVYTDEAMKRRILREKADSDLSIQEIVNMRLALSYEAHPGPLARPEPVSA